jgi:hypothetical protein
MGWLLMILGMVGLDGNLGIAVAFVALHFAASVMRRMRRSDPGEGSKRAPTERLLRVRLW